MGLNFIKYYSVTVFTEKFTSGTLELAEFKVKFDPKYTILLNTNGATRELFLEYPIGRISGDSPKSFSEFESYFKTLPLRNISQKTTVPKGLIAKELAFGVYGEDFPEGKFTDANQLSVSSDQLQDPSRRWEENMFCIFTCRESYEPQTKPRFGLRVTLRQYNHLALIFMHPNRKNWKEPIHIQDLGQFLIAKENLIKVLKVSPYYRDMPESEILKALKIPLKDSYLIGSDSSVLI
jgi:hypothetical protein